MTPDRFWSLIEQARGEAADCTSLADELTEKLATLPPEEILAFQEQLDARLAQAYRWDLWAVAYIVNGGCSDDGFEYFRLWMIGEGREYFEAALREPERAADRAEPEACECEDLLYAPTRAYEARTGSTPPPSDRWKRLPSEPAGDPWTEEDLPRLFPVLNDRFG